MADWVPLKWQRADRTSHAQTPAWAETALQQTAASLRVPRAPAQRLPTRVTRGCHDRWHDSALVGHNTLVRSVFFMRRSVSTVAGIRRTFEPASSGALSYGDRTRCTKGIRRGGPDPNRRRRISDDWREPDRPRSAGATGRPFADAAALMEKLGSASYAEREATKSLENLGARPYPRCGPRSNPRMPRSVRGPGP